MPFSLAPTALQSTLAAKGYLVPTEVQRAVLEAPPDRDLLVSARTGSGKTVAFGLAFASQLLEPLGEGQKRKPKLLVVAPTRELALQVQRELDWLYGETGVRWATCVGGMDIRREERTLFGGVDGVVGTPGRLCDHLARGTLDLSNIKVIVLDEADEMLDMGFREELEQLLRAAPKERRSLMFSATMPKEIEALASEFQHSALRVAVSSPNEAHEDIELQAVAVHPRERDQVVVNVLRFVDASRAIVFCQTREGVNHLHANLAERGFSAVALSAQLSQNERQRALAALRDGRARVLVATDVAARGLDLPSLDLVIHADLPSNPQVLMHRSGRTGRAGRKGLCMVLVPFARKRNAQRLFAVAHWRPAWVPPPSLEQIRSKDDERLVQQLSAIPTEVGEEDRAVARSLLEVVPAEELIAAFVRSTRASWPSPEDPRESLRIREEERPREQRPEPRPDRPDGAWFKVSVGRAQRAHPMWLLPMICRRGNIERDKIGRIDVREKETLFEIDPTIAERFFASARRPDQAEPLVQFSIVTGDTQKPRKPSGPRKRPAGPGRLR